MKTVFINIGFGNIISAGRIIAIVNPGSRALKRLKDEAKDRGKLVDATEGKKVRSIIITDSDHVVLSAIQAETLLNRMGDPKKLEKV